MQEQLVYQPCLIDVLVLEACHYCVPDVNVPATLCISTFPLLQNSC